MSTDALRDDDVVEEVTPITDRVAAPTPRTVLELRDFSVDYGLEGRAVRAVDGVDLHLERSKVLGVAGESGSGKSTLVYGFTRLLRAPAVISGGSAVFNLGPARDGGPDEFVDLVQADESTLRGVRWSQISVVIQSALNALNPVVRVGHLFDQVFRAHRRDMSKAERRARSIELLTLVGLDEDRLERFPHELSGGQRQRIMIALALALDPQLVIMDEPTTALDVVVQREILTRMSELRAELGFSIVFITHDLSLLLEMADQIAVVYAGKVIEFSPAEDVYQAPLHPYTEGLLGSFPSLVGPRRELVGLVGSPPDLRRLPSGCSYHERCPLAAALCAEKAPELVTAGGRSVACHFRSPVPGPAGPDGHGEPASAGALSPVLEARGSGEPEGSEGHDG